MATTTYKIDCGFSSFLLRANFAEASSGITVDFGGDFDEDDTWSTTPFQVADAGHDVEKAVRLVLEQDSEWYVDPSDDRDEEAQLEALMERVTIREV